MEMKPFALALLLVLSIITHTGAEGGDEKFHICIKKFKLTRCTMPKCQTRCFRKYNTSLLSGICYPHPAKICACSITC
ncbi:hypothetical protein FRX31_013029 [Thalictrum thalictroides]|uniref:Defensin-like protein n=1 Tax=Thalictrum thalictroides TaxID=46969 RepID=A0A7J6WLT1_THATH|nr:hypothetical protein FRX31_013029 [Thalictrum thalictroides]